ncbi:alpha/beta hydrolase [Dyella sp. A6]|uniref:alpha/beta hydrolase n=1 Tax=Dyella aluminiiresistens TaxID=3069105 RepID=UPI002E76CF7D|nr:alpha/beta hydrolase [Dyella sp. A6]
MSTLELHRHALRDGESDQQARIFQRNALLDALYPANRRLMYAAMSAQAPLADGVSIEPVHTPEVRGWWVRPENPLPRKTIFYVHGGGYHLGDARSYLNFVSHIAVKTRCAVFCVDYALAPEHRFPAAYDDVRRALSWFVDQDAAEYVAMGDSAGGGLVLATIDQQPVSGAALTSVVVYSPWTDLSNSGASFIDPGTHDPVFVPAVLKGLASSYLDGANALDPRASPLFGIPSQLPPLYIQVGSDELLLDDSLRYADGAAAKGHAVRLDIFDGMYHVFQRDVGVLDTASVALAQAAAFITASWSDGEPRDRLPHSDNTV